MGFLDQMKQGTQRAAWEAERLVRVNKANSAAADTRRELEMQIMHLGRAVLQTYDAGTTPPAEVAPLYGQIKALGAKAQQMEAEVERIKAEQAPQAPQASVPLAPGYTPPAPGSVPPPGYAPQQGYDPAQQGYAPPPQGYAPPPGYAPPDQGYAPPPQGYAPSPQQGYAPTGPAPYAPTGPAPYTPPSAPAYAPPHLSPTADDFVIQPPATAIGYGAPAYETAAAHSPTPAQVPLAAGCPHCHAARTDPTALFCQECGTRYAEG